MGESVLPRWIRTACLLHHGLIVRMWWLTLHANCSASLRRWRCPLMGCRHIAIVLWVEVFDFGGRGGRVVVLTAVDHLGLGIVRVLLFCTHGINLGRTELY